MIKKFPRAPREVICIKSWKMFGRVLSCLILIALSSLEIPEQKAETTGKSCPSCGEELRDVDY